MIVISRGIIPALGRAAPIPISGRCKDSKEVQLFAKIERQDKQQYGDDVLQKRDTMRIVMDWRFDAIEQDGRNGRQVIVFDIRIDGRNQRQ